MHHSITPKLRYSNLLRRAGPLLSDSPVDRVANRLTLEDEISLNRVVVFKVNVLLQSRIGHFELRRFGYVCGRTGNRRKYGIVKRRHVAVGTTKRLHLTVGDVPDPQGALTFTDLESNRRALHGDYLADQLHEVGDRTALFAGINAEEHLFLLLCGPLIYVDDNAPVTFKYVSGDVSSESNSEPGHVYSIDCASFEMMRQYGIASPVIRVDADPARTENFTVADFKQASFEFIGHI